MRAGRVGCRPCTVGPDSINPTVTRGNATAIGSGAYPARSGILGNAMYWPGVNPTGSFSTGDANQLTKLDEVTGGKMVLVQTLGDSIIQRFGTPPSTSGQPNANVRVTYAERILREQLLSTSTR